MVMMDRLSKRKDKCPDCKGTGMGQFYFNKNAPCDTCKGTGEKKQDRPDREKICSLRILPNCLGCIPDSDGICSEIAQIIALIEPLIEEAKKQSLIEYVKDLVKRAKKDYFGLSEGEPEFLSVLGQIIWDMNRVKTQERERIITLLANDIGSEKYFDCLNEKGNCVKQDTCEKCIRQALKGEK